MRISITQASRTKAEKFLLNHPGTRPVVMNPLAVEIRKVLRPEYVPVIVDWEAAYPVVNLCKNQKENGYPVAASYMGKRLRTGMYEIPISKEFLQEGVFHVAHDSH